MGANDTNDGAYSDQNDEPNIAYMLVFFGMFLAIALFATSIRLCYLGITYGCKLDNFRQYFFKFSNESLGSASPTSSVESSTNTSSSVGHAPPTYEHFSISADFDMSDDDNPPEYEDDGTVATRAAGSVTLVTSLRASSTDSSYSECSLKSN